MKAKGDRLFFLAIAHTFMTGKFMKIFREWEPKPKERIKRGEAGGDTVHDGAELFHFLGGIEAASNSETLRGKR